MQDLYRQYGPSRFWKQTAFKPEVTEPGIIRLGLAWIHDALCLKPKDQPEDGFQKPRQI